MIILALILLSINLSHKVYSLLILFLREVSFIEVPTTLIILECLILF